MRRSQTGGFDRFHPIPNEETDHDCSAKQPPLHSSLDSQAGPASIVVLIVGCLLSRSRSCSEQGAKRRHVGSHHLKPQADLVGGRQLSRDLRLLPACLCR